MAGALEPVLARAEEAVVPEAAAAPTEAAQSQPVPAHRSALAQAKVPREPGERPKRVQQHPLRQQLSQPSPWALGAYRRREPS